LGHGRQRARPLRRRGEQRQPERVWTDQLTLDDKAAGPLPINTTLSAGTFQPTDDDTDFPFSFGAIPQDNTGDLFPAPFVGPAPVAASSATMLSVFDGTAPNGTWRLYVADDVQGPEACRINGGWTIDITRERWGRHHHHGGADHQHGGPTRVMLPLGARLGGAAPAHPRR